MARESGNDVDGGAAPMRIHHSGANRLCEEREILGALLPLAGARILELGCGRADLTRAIAGEYPDARITALEVDAVQHARNLAQGAPPNVRFAAGGAEAIPADDGSVDVVLMFKSLHHVPGEFLDRALAEIHRVLAPGGLAYISEPEFAGEYNAIIRIFHDEERVRAAAFAALGRAVIGGAFDLVAERFFDIAVRFASFADFEERVIGVTHTHHHLTEAQHAQVRAAFLPHLRPDGAQLLQPMRVDVLRRRP